MIFRVLSSTPLPEAKRIDAIHFDSELTDCQVSDAVPGGFGGCNLGFSVWLQSQISGTLGTPVDFVDLGHIQIFAGDEKGWLVFEGRVMDMDSPTGRQATAVTATGYGAGEMAATNDMWYSSDPYDGEPTIGGGQLLREIIQASAPILKVGDADEFYEPGGDYLRSGQTGRYPSQAIDEVIKAGDFNNNQVLYTVYEDRVVRLQPRTPPVDENTGETIADYYVPVDRTRVKWRRSGKLMVGVVAAQFHVPGQDSSDHTDWSSQEEMDRFRDAHGGLLRGYLIPNSELMQPQADFDRDTYLERYKNPVMTATVNADNNKWPIFDREGGVIPYYQVRSGGWIKVGDQAPILITSTRKDLKKETLSIVASTV